MKTTADDILKAAHVAIYGDMVRRDGRTPERELAICMLWDARKYLMGQNFTSPRTRPLMGLYTRRFFGEAA